MLSGTSDPMYMDEPIPHSSITNARMNAATGLSRSNADAMACQS
jgi:hypothetical protein